jgi:hypothetical protein
MVQNKVTVTKLPAGRAQGLKRPIVSRKGAQVSIELAPIPARSGGPGQRPWEASGSIDVEQLVVWSFNEQKADRFAGVGLLAAEAAIGGGEPRGRTSDGCAALADIEHMGCRIDRMHGIVRDHVHPVADTVADLVKGMAGGELVVHFGRLGVRPDGWRLPERWWRPVVWKVYGVEGQWERTDRGVNSPRLTRVIPTITQAELERRRQTYVQWWDALDQLAWRLSMRNLGFAVQRPSAPRVPWAGEAE